MGRTRVGHWKFDECDVYIGRGSDWGNPYATAKVARRSKFNVIVSEDPIADFENWIKGNVPLLARLPELQGKILGCFCVRLGTDDRTCHGSVLARLADTDEDGIVWGRCEWCGRSCESINAMCDQCMKS